MARAHLDIALGPDFTEARTLTWKHDGLIVLPTANPTLPTARTATLAQAAYRHQIIDSLPYHLLWFSVYCNDNTSFLGSAGDREFRVGNLIYTIESFSQRMNRSAFNRYRIEMLAVGRADQ